MGTASVGALAGSPQTWLCPQQCAGRWSIHHATCSDACRARSGLGMAGRQLDAAHRTPCGCRAPSHRHVAITSVAARRLRAACPRDASDQSYPRQRVLLSKLRFSWPTAQSNSCARHARDVGGNGVAPRHGLLPSVQSAGRGTLPPAFRTKHHGQPSPRGQPSTTGSTAAMSGWM